MDLKQPEMLKEEYEPVKEFTAEDFKLMSIADGIVERSYLKSVQREEEEELGETRLGEVTVAISVDQDKVPVLTIASRSDYLIERFQDAVQNPHVQRPAIIDLPEEDSDRISRLEAVSVLNYLQKREKARGEEIERLNNYESELGNRFE